MWRAAHNGHLEVVKELTTLGADISHTDHSGATRREGEGREVLNETGNWKQGSERLLLIGVFGIEP